jgi:hypothetical protein
VGGALSPPEAGEEQLIETLISLHSVAFTILALERLGGSKMKPLLSPGTQCRSSWPMIGLVLIVSAVLLGIALLLHFLRGVPLEKLMRDPIAITRVPPYIGFISQISIFFWSASAAFCLFSAKALPRYLDNFKIKRFLLVSGLLTLVLGLDDLFLLHEKILPDLGIPEKAVLVSYAGFVLFYLARFYAILLETEYILLGIALVLFGASIILDLSAPHGIALYLFFEEGAKLVGIMSWMVYFFRTGTSAIYHNTAQQGAASDGYSSAPHSRW